MEASAVGQSRTIAMKPLIVGEDVFFAAVLILQAVTCKISSVSSSASSKGANGSTPPSPPSPAGAPVVPVPVEAAAGVGRVGRVSKAWLRMSCTNRAVAEIFCSSVKVSMRNAYNLTEAEVSVG